MDAVTLFFNATALAPEQESAILARLQENGMLCAKFQKHLPASGYHVACLDLAPGLHGSYTQADAMDTLELAFHALRASLHVEPGLPVLHGDDAPGCAEDPWQGKMNPVLRIEAGAPALTVR